MARSLLALTAVLILASCLASCQAELPPLTPQQIAQLIQILRQKSEALQPVASQITPSEAALYLMKKGPIDDIITGLDDIARTATNANKREFPRVAPITKIADATAVYDAFRDFVRAHQELLDILIEKAGIVEKIYFIGHPMVSAVYGVKTAVDSFTTSLIDLIQDASTDQDLLSQLQSLDGTEDVCVKSYASFASGPPLGRKLMSSADNGATAAGRRMLVA